MAVSSIREISLGRDRGFPIVSEASYARARSTFIGGLISFCARRAHASRLYLEIGRCVSTAAVLGLHAGLEDKNRATWPTLSRLHAALGDFRFISRNRLDSYVAYLERYGFIEKRRSSGDRRVTLITPTERLILLDAAFLGILEAAVRVSEDREIEPEARGPRPAHHLAIRREMMRHLGLLHRAARRHREMTIFLERDSGCLILFLLLQAAEGSEGLDTSLRYDLGAEIASVSRTHVRMLIEDAERAGLLTILEPGGRHIRLSPRLWQATDRWLCDCLSFYRACERRALTARGPRETAGGIATTAGSEGDDEAPVDDATPLGRCRSAPYVSVMGTRP